MQHPLLRNARMHARSLLRCGSRGRRRRKVCRVECVWRARRRWADRQEEWAVGHQWRLQCKNYAAMCGASYVIMATQGLVSAFALCDRT